MNILVTIKDEIKAKEILKLMKKYPFVKVKILKSKKEQIIANLKSAIAEVKLAKQGKKKLKTIDELLNSLPD